jgi:TrmH family RNA methyltransferase
VGGAEDRGLDACWRAAAGDRLVAIPLAPGTVDSLNAATAAAVLLYEVLRQRSAQVREAAVPPAAGR